MSKVTPDDVVAILELELEALRLEYDTLYDEMTDIEHSMYSGTLEDERVYTELQDKHESFEQITWIMHDDIEALERTIAFLERSIEGTRYHELTAEGAYA